MRKISATLDSIQAAFSSSEKQAIELLEGVSPAQANWQASKGSSWSICQCLDHLAKVNFVYSAALQEAASNAKGSYKQPTSIVETGFFGRWFVQQMEPPVNIKLKTPGKAVPAQEGDPRELLQNFLKSHEPIIAVVGNAKSVDVNRLRFKNPFIGFIYFTIGTGLLVINAHDRRHLWQVEQIKKTAGYPAS